MHDYGDDKDFVVPLDKDKHPWNEDLLLDLCKIPINCIARLDKDYVELWIRTIARGLGTSPVPYIKDQMSMPPDIVDDTQEHLDDTYLESLENVRLRRKIWFLKIPRTKMTASTTTRVCWNKSHCYVTRNNLDKSQSRQE